MLFRSAIMIVAWALGLCASAMSLWVLPIIPLIGLAFSALALCITALARSYDFFMYYFTLFISLPLAVRGIAAGHRRKHVHAARVENREVGLLAGRQRADLVIELHGFRAAHRRPVECIRGLRRVLRFRGPLAERIQTAVVELALVMERVAHHP